MSDPRERATSRPPPVVGEGCARRYDPEALSSEDGTDFPGAEELWRQLQEKVPDESERAEKEKGR
ncbi:hypothetical protein [Pseudomonas boanensis]|uniref:hypothetical protein n=1 Tax=Metapseudomonas boanensis TaxID=2822138 RepID=UPI0035D3F97F